MAREFRFVFFTTAYEDTLAFYRDALELPIVGGWDRGVDDRGTLFGAASGIIEVIYHKSQSVKPLQQAFIVFEVEDVDELYHRLQQKGVPIQEAPTDRPWGHRDLKLRDPNGLIIGIFSKIG